MKTPNFWYRKDKKGYFLSFLLFPISWILHLFSVKNYHRHAYISPTPVICIGNFVVGGSGKTTVVNLMADLLKQTGYRVAIITKGYKGSYQKKYFLDTVIQVNPLQHAPSFVGDEPWVLAHKHDVYIGKNRTLIVKKIEKKYDVLLLDDGLQDRKLKKTLIFCTLKEGFEGNNLFIPAGPLRQNVTDALKMTDAIISLGNTCTYGKTFFEVCIDGLSCDIVDRAFLFSGIAHPDDFFHLFQKQYPDIFIVGTMQFPDHHFFTKKDEKILRKKSKGAILITTEKDFCRLHNKNNVLCARLLVRFKDPEQVLNFVTHHLEIANQKGI